MTESFKSAKPVWLSGSRDTWNQMAGFHCSWMEAEVSNCLLRVTAADAYRLWVNGEYAGYGPARTAEGYARIDTWDLQSYLKKGENHLAIEVLGNNVDSYIYVLQPPFLQAEIEKSGEVILSTPSDLMGRSLSERVQKVERFSKQRPFVEAYRLDPECNKWRTEGFDHGHDLEVVPELKHLPRGVPLPALETSQGPQVVAQGNVRVSETTPEAGNATSRSMVGKRVRGYPDDELELDVTVELKRLTFEDVESDGEVPLKVSDSSSTLCDFHRVECGFIGVRLSCEKPTRVFLIFEEIRDRTFVLGVGAITLDLEPGTHDFESMDPYSLRFLRIVSLGADLEVEKVYVRDYAYPTDTRTYGGNDENLSSIFEAARQTFRTNAVDLFTDCPSRERGGYPCDSWFTAMAERVFTGKSEVERNFLENYFLNATFEGIPDGMVPHCYPRSHLGNGAFIPNWGIWLLLQLTDYYKRSRDEKMKELARPTVEGLVAWFTPHINSLGLLENLPGWLFIEWSKANEFVDGVNHPMNMHYAQTLDALGNLYDRPDWREIAASMRQAVLKESWNGQWFSDQSLRVDGRLERQDVYTETCQYHAFWTGLVDRDFGEGLWNRLRDDWGPRRHYFTNSGSPKPDDVDLWPAGLLFGLLLRLDLLKKYGDQSNLLEEVKLIFGHQAELTGTLWEHVDQQASCNHGFASCAGSYIVN